MKRPVPVPPPARILPAIALLLVAWRAAAAPQDTTVLPVENVRVDYAQVLRVQPVYQTLHATGSEVRCDPADDDKAQQGRFSGIVRSVRGVIGRGEREPQADAQDGSNCRTVTVEREFRRPIAYDVDYLYRGMKYRSRLTEDPGNRLRVRVSVTPYVSPLADR